MANLEQNKAIYRKYIDLLNAQNLEALPEVVDVSTYREVCVGAAPGWMNYDEAIKSVKKIYPALPDLHVAIDDLVAEGDKIFARCTVTATNTGKFFGLPPTNRKTKVSMFDYAMVKNGKIIERYQQADNLGQLTQLFGPLLKFVVAVVVALFLLLIILALII